MIAQMTNWSEIYRSLQLDTLKTSGIWMSVASVVSGIIMILLAGLFFRNDSIIQFFVIGIVVLFVFYFQWKLLLLYKSPRVFTGRIYDKYEKRRVNDTDGSEKLHCYVKMEVVSSFTIDKYGNTHDWNEQPIRVQLNCPSHLFEYMVKGSEVTLLIMPHNDYIARMI